MTTLRRAAISAAALLLVLGLAQTVAALETVIIRSCYDGDTCRTTDGQRIRLAMITSGHAEISWRYADQCSWAS